MKAGDVPWTRAAKISDIPEGGGVLLTVEGKKIALLRSEDKYYAIENSCPHRGAPLSLGHAQNCQVTCSWHAWAFDLKTGECLSVPEVKLITYPVKVERDDIFVQA